MEKIACLCVLLILLFCSACADTGAIDVIPPDKLIYSNLDSEASMREVRDILIKAGIQADHVDTVLSWVTDYNNSMRECPSFSLAGDFITADGMIVDYGEYAPKSIQWYNRNNRNYDDVLCRIAAYELIQDNISVGEVIKEENFDCWDETTAWLYSDGNILFGRKDVEGFMPFPLIDWSKDMQAEYFTLFQPVHITEQCSEQEMFRAIQEKWNEQKISFRKSAFSLITFWTQSGNEIGVSHAAAKFSSADSMKQYLYNMMNLESSRNNIQMGTYIILQNDNIF